MYIEITLAFLFDLLIGDPEYKFHPVRIIGRMISFFEYPFRKISRNQKFNGLLFALFINSLSFFSVFIIIYLLSKFNIKSIIIVKTLVIIFFIYSSLSLKDLCKKSGEIYALLSKKEIVKAREKLGMIVGRETAKLGEKEMIRATIETVAENIVDGVISPLFYCFLGGAPLMILYKSVNTLDSMVGYKNEKYMDFGWASAHIDDIFNFIPARLSMIIIPVSFFLMFKNGFRSFKIALRDGAKNPSPNSGLPEAAFAGGLGIELGGINYYHGKKSSKPLIGEKVNELELKHIKDSIKIAYITGILFLIIGLLLVYLIN